MQSKGSNSSKANATLMKLHLHYYTMVIYVQYKFHKNPSIGYQVMAEDITILQHLGYQGVITLL